MSKYRAIVIDDTKSVIETMELIINQFLNSELEIVASYTSASDGLKGILEIKPDLVFLDIEMPEINGLELASLLPIECNSKIVIISGKENYALKAIKQSVFDYLLKPISVSDIKNVVLKLNKEVNILETELEINNNILIVNRQDKAVFIELNSISKIEANGACSEIYYHDKKIGSTKSFKHYEGVLPKHIFLKIHRSCIININFIKEVIKQDGFGYIILKDNSKIELSKIKKDEMLNKLMNLIKN